MKKNKILRFFRILKKTFLRKSYYSLFLKKLELDDNGHSKAILQVSGKPVFLNCSVKELMMDEKILYQLPPAQIKMIVKLACHELNMPVYRIYAINQGMFTLLVKEIATDNVYEFHVKEIKEESSLIDNFSKKDLLMIGILYNDYLLSLENECLENIKRPNLRIVSSTS